MMVDSFVIGDGGLVSVVVADSVPVGVLVADPEPVEFVGVLGPQGLRGEVGPVGPVGPAGAASTVPGPVGATGATGPVGPIGLTGATGSAGSAGAAATVAVGTVSTGSAGSSAVVTNAGTSSAAVLDFTIPRGEVGATGATGPAGTTLWSGLSGVPAALTTGANVANGFAGLDGAGLVPASVLPSYVDDVLEFANLAAFPVTGESGKIYVDSATGKVHRWTGSVYVEVSPSPGSTDSVTEGSTNLYYTSARAAAAAPVQSVAGKTGAVTLAKADVGLGNVDNTADAAKPVSTATNTALSGKEPTVTAGTTSQYYRGDKTFQTLDKTAVGLGSVDNSADSSKAVLSATRLATARSINGVSFDGSADVVTSKPRVGTVASSATPSIDCGSFDQYTITALAAAITGVTVTGTATDGQKLMVRIKDNGTARAITWGASFVSSGVATLLATTVASKTHMVGFIYDSAAASGAGRWVCVAVDTAGY